MLNYQISGKGPCLVFLHGFIENITMWKTLIQELSVSYTCLSVDLPGHGDSPNMLANETIASMGSKVLTLLDHLNISDYKLIGHSMGGYVALAMAREYEQICLINSHVGADTPEKKKNRLKSLPIIEHKYGFFVREVVPNLFSKTTDYNNHSIQSTISEALKHEGKQMARATWAMMLRPDSTERMNSLKCTITLIIGVEDSIISQTLYAQQIEALNLCQPYILDNCGHMAHIEAYEDTLAILKLFSNQKILVN